MGLAVSLGAWGVSNPGKAKAQALPRPGAVNLRAPSLAFLPALLPPRGCLPSHPPSRGRYHHVALLGANASVTDTCWRFLRFHEGAPERHGCLDRRLCRLPQGLRCTASTCKQVYKEAEPPLARQVPANLGHRWGSG